MTDDAIKNLDFDKSLLEGSRPDNKFDELIKALYEYWTEHHQSPDFVYMSYSMFIRHIAKDKRFNDKRIADKTKETILDTNIIYAEVSTDNETWFRFFSESELDKVATFFGQNLDEEYYYDLTSAKIHRDIAEAYIWWTFCNKKK